MSLLRLEQSRQKGSSGAADVLLRGERGVSWINSVTNARYASDSGPRGDRDITSRNPIYAS